MSWNLGNTVMEKEKVLEGSTLGFCVTLSDLSTLPRR